MARLEVLTKERFVLRRRAVVLVADKGAAWQEGQAEVQQYCFIAQQARIKEKVDKREYKWVIIPG